MRRPALAALALTVLALAGCSNEAAEEAPTPPTRTTTAAPTTTADPLARFSTFEQAFVRGVERRGFTLPGGPAQTIELGELICSEIRNGTRPADTQAALATGEITAEDSAAFYDLAYTNLCPELTLPDPNSFSSGTYEVGVDIQPGRYRSPGGDGCYWARLDGGQEIIDNNLSDGPTVFDVAESDVFVELSRCTWTLAE
jgi:hypothetical protein